MVNYTALMVVHASSHSRSLLVSSQSNDSDDGDFKKVYDDLFDESLKMKRKLIELSLKLKREYESR